MAIQLTGSVGRGGVNNPDDVIAVKERLDALGFSFFGGLHGQINDTFINTITLFQAIKNGRQTVRGDGRVDVGFSTHRYLDATNAPRWQLMPRDGAGFINIEARQTSDNHDFGTNWMAQTIIDAGIAYQRDFRRANPGAGLMAINDVSKPQGGFTRDHSGHQTGLSCDLRPARTDGQPNPVRVNSAAYDRNAMRAMLKAIRQQPLVTKVFFNDNVLMSEGLCSFVSGHHDHVHFEITAPDPVP